MEAFFGEGLLFADGRFGVDFTGECVDLALDFFAFFECADVFFDGGWSVVDGA